MFEQKMKRNTWGLTNGFTKILNRNTHTCESDTVIYIQRETCGKRQELIGRPQVEENCGAVKFSQRFI